LVIVLDNAANENHVRQLIPASGRSLVIITSRKPGFVGLQVKNDIKPVLIEIEPFTLDDSLELLRRSLGSVIDDKREAATMVAQYCGHLPLALGIAVALLDSRKFTIAELANELAESTNRLDTLTIDDDSDLWRIFSASYRRLKADCQRAFRLLGLRLRQGIDEYGVALLTGTRECRSRQEYRTQVQSSRPYPRLRSHPTRSRGL
jgi:hypothetical protein